MIREKLSEDNLLERKQSLLNQLHPSKMKQLSKSTYDSFRKKKLAEILKIEKTLARLKGYYSKIDQ